MNMIDKSSFMPFSFLFSFILFITCANGQLGLIGTECWTSTDCSPRNSYCLDYRCTCADPYVPSDDARSCTVATGNQCTESGISCYDPNARCTRSTGSSVEYCECMETFVQHTDTRVCLRALNQNCTEDGIACVDGSCENDKCECSQPLVANSVGSRCVTALGDNCVQNQECSDAHASCVENGPCVCNDEFQQVQRADGSSLCLRILGATCDKDEDCADENAFCESTRQATTICNCHEGYVRSTDTRKCLPVPLSWPGSCEENQQCMGAFGILSSCSISNCVCPMGYAFSENDGGCNLSITTIPRVN